MKFRTKHLLLIVVICVFQMRSFAQFSMMDFIFRPTTIQVGWHALDDDASAFKGLLKHQNWSMLYYPTRVTVSKTVVSNLKAELALAYTKMNKAAYASERYLAPGVFFCADLNVRYNFTISFPALERLDQPKATPLQKLASGLALNFFPVGGFGYSQRSQTEFAKAATLNLGFGGTLWLNKNKFGIVAQTMGKWGLQKPIVRAGSNYIHHSVGLIYVTDGNPIRRSSNRFSIGKKSKSKNRTSKNRF
jgi:hypothetical protein